MVQSRRRALAGLVLLLAAAAAALLTALASIPRLLGDRTGAGFASTEQRLCVLGRDGTAGIVVAGDSRAKSQIVPAILAEATGRRCINVAENLDLGGDLATLANALRRSPAALASRPLLIVSVSMEQVNDGGIARAPSATLFNLRPADHARLALDHPLRYPAFLWSRWLPAVRRELRHLRDGTAFACDDDARIHPVAARTLGFHGLPRIDFIERPKAHLAASDYTLDGARWRIFRASLATLASLPLRGIVLVNGPIDSARYLRMSGGAAWRAQERFAAQVGAEAARHPGVRYWDFRAAMPDPSLYYYADHLLEEGARRYSGLLGERLRSLEAAGGRAPGKPPG